MLAVYLMSARRLSGDRLERHKLEAFEYFKTGFFFGSVAALIIMLGLLGIGTLRSALYAATMLLVALTILYVVFKFVRRSQDYQGQRFLGNLRESVETFADLAWYIVLLLATLGIMIGLFTLTGFLQRMGSLLLDLTQWSVVATILVAWVFGWLAGTGLPPTATYVVVAVIIVPPLIQSGIDPWIAHFFAFLLAIWGELSPPTSLTAAVAARIAESSFMVTMFQALKICLPIVLMSFAIFVRCDAIVQQGWAQVPDTILLALGCMAVIFAATSRFFVDRWADTAGRLVLAGLGAVVLFHPSFAIAAATSAVVVVLLALGIQRVRRSGAWRVPAPAS